MARAWDRSMDPTLPSRPLVGTFAALRAFSHGRCNLQSLVLGRRIQALGTTSNVSSDGSCRGHVQKQVSKRHFVPSETESW